MTEPWVKIKNKCFDVKHQISKSENELYIKASKSYIRGKTTDLITEEFSLSTS